MTTRRTRSRQETATPFQRKTRQRDALLAVFAAAEGPLSAREAWEAAAKDESLGLATVYRLLKLLQESGELRLVVSPKGGHYFEKSGPAHHHFQCDRCEKVWDLAPCAKECQPRQIPKLGIVRTHEVFYFGTCARCA